MFSLIAQISKETRYTVRVMLRNPGFCITTCLVLALGIGATTSIFSIVNAMLISSLPFRNPDQLVSVSGVKLSFSDKKPRPDLGSFKESFQSFDEIAAYAIGDLNITIGNEAESMRAAQITSGFFQVLGRSPSFGRGFLSSDEKPGQNQVAILSNRLWRDRFSSDLNVIGQTLAINGVRSTVIGVMPADFTYPVDVSLWVPIGCGDDTIFRGSIFYWTIARLKPTLTIEQARAEIDVVSRASQTMVANSLTRPTIQITSLRTVLTGQIKKPLLVLLGAVGLVLLVACANIANLFLIKSARRHKEFAIRAALGATRWQILCHVLIESVFLALLGGALGTLLAYGTLDLLISISPVDLPRLNNVRIDASVLAFTTVISIITGVIFGIAPALWASGLNLNEALKETTENSLLGPRRQRYRSLLIVSEIALSLVLLTVAGLFIRSFLELMKADVGLNSVNVLTMQISLPQSKYPDSGQRIDFYHQLLDRLGALPGVRAVGVVNCLPLSDLSSVRFAFNVEGTRSQDRESAPVADLRITSPDYFRALSIPLLKGRPFAASDVKESPKVIIVNDSFAERFLRGKDTLGMRMNLAVGKPEETFEIVGVVGNVRHWGVDVPPDPEVYIPYLQRPTQFMNVVVQAGANPENLLNAARNEVRAIDKDQSFARIKTMDRVLTDAVSLPRFNMLLMSIFALFALVLAAVGIFGFISYSIAQRTREIGIRMALGAQAADVVKIVIKQSLVLVMIGVAAGLTLSFVSTRIISSYLYEVTNTDLATYVTVPLLIIAVALLSVFIPAHRATKIDPAVALRRE